MRFLLDEMYSQKFAEGCRARGVDVVSVHERPELEGEPDDAEVDGLEPGLTCSSVGRQRAVAARQRR